MSKATSGKFYIPIDQQLKKKRCHPDSTYGFVDNIVYSSRSSKDVMYYGKNYSNMK